MNDHELLKIAFEASKNAYAPYSRFAVGAALGSSICAERTAVCKAVSEGQTRFRRIAIYADSPNYCMPCGACRQVLAEFSTDMEVLCAKSGGRYVSYRLEQLMPHQFKL